MGQLCLSPSQHSVACTLPGPRAERLLYLTDLSDDSRLVRLASGWQTLCVQEDGCQAHEKGSLRLRAAVL